MSIEGSREFYSLLSEGQEIRGTFSGRITRVEMS